ncbi:26S proteasome regulatory subunit 8-like [Varroa destructor]|uniref:AAA+ ATPase domain-containing protein n=1 Tax=Varroa destructor TaxID=109461 RepID=A0A7M7KLH6_VARDE|nr:26S proteasome regulatory subunit 8-like [Varroa destructor]XP_022668691.1 26S proteasome regulatory subunit 8-like [Varroa destructor]
MPGDVKKKNTDSENSRSDNQKNITKNADNLLNASVKENGPESESRKTRDEQESGTLNADEHNNKAGKEPTGFDLDPKVAKLVLKTSERESVPEPETGRKKDKVKIKSALMSNYHSESLKNDLDKIKNMLKRDDHKKDAFEPADVRKIELIKIEHIPKKEDCSNTTEGSQKGESYTLSTQKSDARQDLKETSIEAECLKGADKKSEKGMMNEGSSLVLESGQSDATDWAKMKTCSSLVEASSIESTVSGVSKKTPLTKCTAKRERDAQSPGQFEGQVDNLSSSIESVPPIKVGKGQTPLKKGSPSADRSPRGSPTKIGGRKKRRSGPSKPGLRNYYIAKIEVLENIVSYKTRNLRRLQAQRNELNAQVRALREELERLRYRASYVGEVVKRISENKVLVHVSPEEKYIVDVEADIDMKQLTPNCRVALREDTYKLHKILPDKIDPLVSLMMVEKVPDSNFSMIGGLDNQIKEIKEVIELPIKHPELFEALGITQPKGVLLYGPPGTGKTLLARAVAHHTKCAFIRVSGSELVQKFIGEGSRMVRDIFVMARKHSPSIIFVDEIDSIGSARTIEADNDSNDSEVHRTMLELLNQLDGFEPTQNIKVIMATNRIDVLDPALLRSGRIDRKIEFPPPNERSRLDILRIHSRKMNLTRNVDLKKIVEKMAGASGAEVKAICTEAGMYALREGRMHVTQEDFEMAVVKVLVKRDAEDVSVRKTWK